MVKKTESKEPLAASEVQPNSDVTSNPAESPEIVLQQPDAYMVHAHVHLVTRYLHGSICHVVHHVIHDVDGLK